jgi:hypothetical protein
VGDLFFPELLIFNIVTKSGHFVREIVAIRFPVRNIRNSSVFGFSSTHFASAICASSANSVRKFIDIVTDLLRAIIVESQQPFSERQQLSKHTYC